MNQTTACPNQTKMRKLLLSLLAMHSPTYSVESHPDKKFGKSTLALSVWRSCFWITWITSKNMTTKILIKKLIRRIWTRMTRKPPTRKELLWRRESLLTNFTIRELENPITRRDFCRAMDNIDRALPKSREW